MSEIIKQGNLSIDSENMFPIIKKWLYSDRDIFYRELISNGCDAITKLKKLELMGETELPADYKPRIDVAVSPHERTITVSDNGLGMSASEIEEYINRIAFSGAKAFLDTYKDKTNEDQLIGHFGLGFYSAFMVPDSVTIETKSWDPTKPAVFWESDGGQTFEMSRSDRSEVGTTVTLHVNEDSVEFCNEYRAREVLQKYCSFMPVEIYLKNADEDLPKPGSRQTEEQTYEEMAEELLESAEKKAAADEEPKEVPINETDPLWNRSANDLTDEDYKKFYRTTFNDYKEPIFWIHLNMDYPFRLKGILYFPRLTSEYDSIEGVIKLYNNQVFVADNIKEVIPEYLLILKGVIDCPDLPLNVSRSALQNDGFVKKISEYITKKVADKLSGMYKTDQENYEKCWEDLAPFVKYGYIRDEKFREKIADFILYKNLNDEFVTLKECIEVIKYENADAPEQPEVIDANIEFDEETGETRAKDAADEGGAAAEDAPEDAPSDLEEPEEKTIYYVSNARAQTQYIQMFKDAGKEAVYLDTYIDPSFITYVEQFNEGLHFACIDSVLDEDLRDDFDADDESFKENAEKLTETFKKALDREDLAVSVEMLKDESIAAMITKSEDSRRLDEMMRRYGQRRDMGDYGRTLVLNAKHPLVQYILEHGEEEQASEFCEQLYDLALMAHGPLPAERMSGFVQRSNRIMMELMKNN